MQQYLQWVQKTSNSFIKNQNTGSRRHYFRFRFKSKTQTAQYCSTCDQANVCINEISTNGDNDMIKSIKSAPDFYPHKIKRRLSSKRDDNDDDSSSSSSDECSIVNMPRSQSQPVFQTQNNNNKRVFNSKVIILC